MAGAWDPVHGRIVLFGGFTQSSIEYKGDGYALRLAGAPVWTLLTPNGSGPSPRGSMATAVDARRGRLLVFGGSGDLGGAPRTNEVWAMSFADSAWTELTPQGVLPSIRAGAIAAFDSLSDRVFAYGGFTGVDFSEVNWTLRFADDVVSVPSPRGGAAFALHGAVPNPVRGDFSVSFRLPDAVPARLEVFDVAGRRVAAADVGGRGAGVHTVRLGAGGTFRPGVYLLRLTRGAEQRIGRAVVLN